VENQGILGSILIGPGIFFALISLGSRKSFGREEMRKKMQTVAVLLAFAAPAMVSAEESQTETTILDEVVVTASRVAESKNDVSANLTVITSEDLSHSVSRNVGDILAEKGIGHVQKYPGNLTSIAIRGFRTDTHGNDLQGHVLVLLDGRRAGTGNVAKILTKNVERIEIIRGPGAVQYGSAGMGGVVNIITRQGEENSLFVEAGGGSYGAGETSVGGTFKKNGFDFAGSFTYQTANDYDTGDGDRYRNTGVNYETGVSANLGYSFSEQNRIGLIVTHFDVDEAGNPGYLSANDLDDISDKENYSVDINYTGKSGSEQYQWFARYFFGKDKNRWLDPVGSDPSGWDDGIASNNKTDQQGAQAQITGVFAETTITTGFDWLDYEVKNSWTPQKTTYTNPALFLLGKSAFFDHRLVTNIGLRYDWYEVEVSKPAGRDEDQSHFTPKFGAAFMVTDSLKIRAQFGMGFMMPSADQLAADFTNWGVRTVGNPDLDPEESTTYEGGVDYNHAGFNGSLTYFYTDFEDKITRVTLTSGDSSWDNIGDATIAGFEMELSYDLGVPFQWAWEVRPYFGLTQLTEYEDDATGDDLQYVSDTNFSAGVVVSDGDGISCRLNVAYAGSQDVMDYESGWPYQKVELPSSTVADLSASFRLLENEQLGALTLRNEIRNLFDKDYAYVKGYPMPGRSFFMGLRWDY
jgi:vitamin B12 transporter